MTPSNFTRIVLNERPETYIQPTTFKKEVVPFDLKPGAGEVLVKTNWLSLDPAMRGWIKDRRSYLPPVQIGETMRSLGLATVVEAGEGTKLVPGDVVSAAVGWTEYAVLKESAATKLQIFPGGQALDFLGPIGMSAYTAYFGLLEVAKLKAGETLVVSGAAGAVGSVACQIGKIYGAKVVAIAGTDEKCKWLKETIGVDAVLNYKSPTYKEDFIAAVDYLDVFLDNVGGDILDFALTRLKKNARIAFSGAISDYNNTSATTKGLTNYQNLIAQAAILQGFLVFDYVTRFPEAIKALATWLSEGKLVRRFTIVEGLEKAPEALPMLFDGGNTGKLVVHVDGLEAQYV
ncbi:alcohol dehydrogenase [Auriscalpium vulgare]|uniref:Alcohol dehydrogenase n=1 Tax=Auriscalpium vulgare TaxID=40419 RepID=A0ACB8S5C3_9AGAM|nr:alcohol dehydrogenase [Auriscalpium vulgare]